MIIPSGVQQLIIIFRSSPMLALHQHLFMRLHELSRRILALKAGMNINSMNSRQVSNLIRMFLKLLKRKYQLPS
jgi:hypothetical protein